MAKVLWSIGLLFVAINFSDGSLLAAKENQFRMAVVDFQKALNSVEEGKAFVSELQKEAEAKQKELQKREEELQKLQTELEALQMQAQSGLLAPERMEEARRKQTEYQTKMEAFFNLRQQSGQEIAEKEQTRRIEMLRRMREIVNELGRQEGYSMVLERNESGLLYAAAVTDLTERLIQNYNQRHKAPAAAGNQRRQRSR